MPFEIKSARPNVTAYVSIVVDTGERTVALRGKYKAYSLSLTPDMRTQSKIGYIKCTFVTKIPTGDKFDVTPKVIKSVKSTPSKHRPVKTVVTNQAPTVSPVKYTYDDLKSLKKKDLQEIADSLGIDVNQTKENLINDILSQ